MVDNSRLRAVALAITAVGLAASLSTGPASAASLATAAPGVADAGTGSLISPHRVGDKRLGERFTKADAKGMRKLPGCRFWIGPHDSFVGVNANRRITSALVSDEKFGTVKGVGPGSTLRAVRRAYPKAVLRSGQIEGDKYFYLTSRAGQDRLHFVFEERRPLEQMDSALVTRGETPGHWAARLNGCGN